MWHSDIETPRHQAPWKGWWLHERWRWCGAPSKLDAGSEQGQKEQAPQVPWENKVLAAVVVRVGARDQEDVAEGACASRQPWNPRSLQWGLVCRGRGRPRGKAYRQLGLGCLRTLVGVANGPTGLQCTFYGQKDDAWNCSRHETSALRTLATAVVTECCPHSGQFWTLLCSVHLIVNLALLSSLNWARNGVALPSTSLTHCTRTQSIMYSVNTLSRQEWAKPREWVVLQY